MKWISVQDKLPETYDTVAVVTFDESEDVQEKSHDAYNPKTKKWDWIRTHQIVTHWMPLPDLPNK